MEDNTNVNAAILERLEKYIEQTICESDLSLGDQFASYFGFGQEKEPVRNDAAV